MPALSSAVNHNPPSVVPITVASSSYSGLVPENILAAAARGWRVFPIKSGTKKNALVKWGQEASSALDKIAGWALRWPGCNWGLATGERSGLFVIDTDSSEGWMWFVSKGLPETYIVKTGKDDPFAYHYYFRRPAGIKIKTVASIVPGLDVRGDGGMVIAPPSIHPVSGNRYAIVDAREVAEAPGWLIELVKDTREERSAVTPSDLDPLSADQMAFGRNIFLKACREFAALPAGTGVRNASMNKLGFLTGSLIARDCFDLDFAQAATLEYAADYIAQDGLREVMRTFQSGVTAGMASPWVPLADSPEDVFGTAVLTGLPATGVVEGVSGPIARGGDGILNAQQQRGHFAGCVYIQSQHRVLVPGGDVLKPEAFKVLYGGFTFTLDNRNDKITRDAFEAFTQSQANCPEKAFSTCFKPQLAFGAIVLRDGQRFVNTYYPVNVERKAGDASPFLNHLAKVLPNQRDADIFLSYMAAVVQHQGVKFQWAPLLQGVPGNGKSIFSSCVERAVGARYTHWPTAKKLSEKFNLWMTGKVFYAVEDIYVPDSKREILEDLKPMITGRSLEIEGKGVDQVTSDICGNFIFNTNHKDGLIKTEDDRRYSVLFTAQQSVADLHRDGMPPGGDYFPELWGWLRDEGGYAIVNELLHTYAIPAALNPAGNCQRAPETSTTLEAIAVSKGGIEQEIEEAIAQGLPGFRGEWLSTIMLGRFLEEKGLGRRAPLNKRQQILKQMGYVPHPALKDGRVNNLVLPDNSKPRLFIREGALAAQIVSPVEAAKAYEAANGGSTSTPAAQRAFGSGV